MVAETYEGGFRLTLLELKSIIQDKIDEIQNARRVAEEYYVNKKGPIPSEDVEKWLRHIDPVFLLQGILEEISKFEGNDKLVYTECDRCHKKKLCEVSYDKCCEDCALP